MHKECRCRAGRPGKLQHETDTTLVKCGRRGVASERGEGRREGVRMGGVNGAEAGNGAGIVRFAKASLAMSQCRGTLYQWIHVWVLQLT